MFGAGGGGGKGSRGEAPWQGPGAQPRWGLGPATQPQLWLGGEATENLYGSKCKFVNL